MARSGSQSETAASPPSPAGVRAELEVDPGGTCPLVSVASELDASAQSMRRAPGEKPGTVVEQFAVDDPEGTPTEVEAEPVFDYTDRRIYQVTREEGGCVCELVEQLDAPVADVEARDGSLFLTLHLQDVDRLRDVVGELQDNFAGVNVRYLAQTGADREGEDLIPVDRGRLTDRQREVLTTAYEMGYFEYPRESNASDVAEELGIGLSTMIEHLTAAQSKLLEDVLEH